MVQRPSASQDLVNTPSGSTAGLGAQYKLTKMQFPKKRKGYDNSETTVGKLLTRRTQIFRVYFCVVRY